MQLSNVTVTSGEGNTAIPAKRKAEVKVVAGNTANVPMATFTNELIAVYGSLKITKTVTVNNDTPDATYNAYLTNGEYVFNVAGVEDSITEDVTHVIRIKFEDGNATKYQIDSESEQEITNGANNTWTVELTDLIEGDYTITEADPENGTELASVDGGNADQDNRTITATVTAGQTGENVAVESIVSFINNYEPMSIPVKKIWSNEYVPSIVSSVAIGLYTDEECTVSAKDINGVNVAELILNSVGEWKGTFTNLPDKDSNGDSISYYIKETAINYVSGTVDADGNDLTSVTGDNVADKFGAVVGETTEGEDDDAVTYKTITNTCDTSVRVDKTWLQFDGTTSVTEQIQNASIKVQLKNGDTVVTTDMNGDPIGESGTVTLNGIENWSYTWNNLPKYDDHGDLIAYSIVETEAKVNTDDVLLSETDTPQNAEPDETIAGFFHLRNPLPETEILVNKEWENETDQNWPEEIKEVTVGLYKGSATEPFETITFDQDTPEADRTFSNLPVYENDGSKTHYSVKEISVTLNDVSDTVVQVTNNQIIIAEGTQDERKWIVITGQLTKTEQEEETEEPAEQTEPEEQAESATPEYTVTITNSQNANKVFVVKRWHNAYGRIEEDVDIPVSVSLYEVGTNKLVGTKDTPATFAVDPEKQYYAVETTTEGYLVWYATEPLETTPHSGNIMTNQGTNATVSAGGTIYVHNTATQVSGQVKMHKKWIEFRDTGGQFYLGQLDGDNTFNERYKMKLDVDLYYDIYDLDGNKLTFDSLKATDTFRVWHSNSGHTFEPLHLNNNIVNEGDDFVLIEISDWGWGFKEGEQNGNQGELHGKLPLYGYYKVNDQYQLVKYAYHFEEYKVWDGSEDWDNPKDVTKYWWKLWQNKKEDNDTAYIRTNIENRPKRLPVKKEWYTDDNTKITEEEMATYDDLMSLKYITVILYISFDNKATWHEGASLTLENGAWSSCFENLESITEELGKEHGATKEQIENAQYKVEEIWDEEFARLSLNFENHEGVLKNKIMPKGSIKIQKVWPNGEFDADAVLLKLGRASNNAVDDETVLADIYEHPENHNLDGKIYEDSSHNKYIKLAKEGNSWPTIEITNLLMKHSVQDTDGSDEQVFDCYYFIEEAGYLVGDTMYSIPTDEERAWTVAYSGGNNYAQKNAIQAKKTNPDTLVVSNTVPTTSISVTKKWYEADGTTEKTLEDGATIKFTAFYKVEGDNTAHPYTVEADENDGTYSITYNSSTHSWSTVTLSNLPYDVRVSTDDGDQVKTVTGYGVEELTEGMNVEVTYKAGEEKPVNSSPEKMTGTITIINADSTGSIIVKKAFNGIDDLPGAFTITASWNDPTIVVADGSEDLSGGTEEAVTPGRKSVVLSPTAEPTGDTTGLTITRTKTEATAAVGEAPEQPAFYTWTIDGLPIGTEITFTENAEGCRVDGYTWDARVKEPGDVEDKDGTSGMGTVANPAETVEFSNFYTPGVELPSTGGSGTLIYTIAGMALVVLAGVLLVSRKRKTVK